MSKLISHHRWVDPAIFKKILNPKRMQDKYIKKSIRNGMVLICSNNFGLRHYSCIYSTNCRKGTKMVWWGERTNYMSSESNGRIRWLPLPTFVCDCDLKASTDKHPCTHSNHSYYYTVRNKVLIVIKLSTQNSPVTQLISWTNGTSFGPNGQMGGIKYTALSLIMPALYTLHVGRYICCVETGEWFLTHPCASVAALYIWNNEY